MKRLLTKDSNDWENFFGIKISSEQKAIDKDMRREINENGIYAIFDKSNSKDEITKRLRDRKNEFWNRAGIVITGIGVLVATAKRLFGL